MKDENGRLWLGDREAAGPPRPDCFIPARVVTASVQDSFMTSKSGKPNLVTLTIAMVL
jgi:hypothetical protein